MFRISRRYFLQMAGTAVAAVTLTPLGSFAFGQGAGRLVADDDDALPQVRRGKTLVLLFLRGGMDGLNLVVPFGDRHYYDLRPGISLRPPTRREAGPANCLDLDGFYGLHPRAAGLYELFRQGQLAILPAVGSPANNRSHFAQQDQWETGYLGNTTTADGWLNRHLQSTRGHGVLRAVHIGSAMPRVLRGEAPVTVIRNVEDLAYQNRYGDPRAIQEHLERLYGDRLNGGERRELAEGARGQVEETNRRTLEGLRVLEEMARTPYVPAAAANYPNSGLANQFQSVAQLVKAGIGLEVAQIDVGGWDTHRNQGTDGGGTFAQRVGLVGDAVAAFMRDLGDKRDDVLILTLTEFGRTARENGSSGTDHGHASAMLAIGGAINAANSGGKVLGEWPGLSPEQLNQGRDLKHTIDFRDLVVEVMNRHKGNGDYASIMPGHDPQPVNLLPAEHAVPMLAAGYAHRSDGGRPQDRFGETGDDCGADAAPCPQSTGGQPASPCGTDGCQ